MARQKFVHFVPRPKPKKSVLEGIRKDFQSQKKRVINLIIDKGGLIKEDDKNYEIINGKKVPVYKAKVVETIKTKEQGKFMIIKLILILMLLIPILTLLWMIFNKT